MSNLNFFFLIITSINDWKKSEHVEVNIVSTLCWNRITL